MFTSFKLFLGAQIKYLKKNVFLFCEICKFLNLKRHKINKYEYYFFFSILYHCIKKIIKNREAGS